MLQVSYDQTMVTSLDRLAQTCTQLPVLPLLEALVTAQCASPAPPPSCSSSPCHNGGSCSDIGDNSYTCACTEDYSGTQCDTPWTAPAFTVVSGPCTACGSCVGRPAGYDDNESCEIVPTGSFTLSSCQIFDTEQNFVS